MNKVEIKAYSAKEAIELAKEMGINIKKNITASWIKAGNPMDSIDFKEFMDKMLHKNKIANDTEGVLIIAESGVKNTRTRPYKFVNNVADGRTKIKRTIELVTVDGVIVGSAENKSDASKLAKELMPNLKQDLTAVVKYHVVEGTANPFVLKYEPSKETKLGTYVVVTGDKY